MPKPQYQQKFRTIWLKDPALKQWLVSIESTEGIVAKCKVCNKTLRNHYGDLKLHGSTVKHKHNITSVFGATQLKICFPKEECLTEAKIAEAKLSLFIAQHIAIHLSDHLVDVCKASFSSKSGSERCCVDHVQMHKTKCSGIIKNVLYPHFIKDLVLDIGKNRYSLLVDESTDIATQKYLGIVIIYYSTTANKIVTTSLELAALDECNADAIVYCIKSTLNKYHLPLDKMVGLGCDNASVMTGVNNGVYKKLKDEVPHLFLVRCVCHSLQLAVSAATKDFLPRNLEFLIQETYNWFSCSSQRQGTYKQLYNTINDNHDPLKIVQACKTRWLSIESAVTRILDQWIELKTHFEISRLSEKCYTAEMLFQMFKDEKNEAFLLFLRPILSEIQKVNKLFEGNDIDPTKLLSNLILLLQSLVTKIVRPGTRFDYYSDEVNIDDYVDTHCYLGFGFESKIRELRNNSKMCVQDEEDIRQRCIQFTISLIKQIRNRLPENLKLLQKINCINVEETLKQNKIKLTEILIEFKKTVKEIEIIEQQWANISLLKWSQIKDTKLFWYEVSGFKDGSGNNPFKELAEFALHLLIIPHSNADVERLFSTMNFVKNKVRNRMLLPMLQAILTIKAGLKRHDSCCNDYTLPTEVISKIKTNACYTTDFEIPDFVI